MTQSPKACIIGAGCSGFTTAKRLKDLGVPYDCFEMSDNIGGNWYYNNPNGHSACYQSLHIDTSKWRLAFEDYPVPAGWPDFPHHSQLLQYFNDYVDHFGLRETITFNTAVTRAVRDADGLWNVTLSTGETRYYDILFVCNGHHWSPRTPEYPGHFDGVSLHSHGAVPAAPGGPADRLGPAGRLGPAQIHERPSGGQGGHAPLDAPQAGPGPRPPDHQEGPRCHGGLWPAQARP